MPKQRMRHPLATYRLASIGLSVCNSPTNIENAILLSHYSFVCVDFVSRGVHAVTKPYKIRSKFKEIG